MEMKETVLSAKNLFSGVHFFFIYDAAWSKNPKTIWNITVEFHYLDILTCQLSLRTFCAEASSKCEITDD